MSLLLSGDSSSQGTVSSLRMGKLLEQKIRNEMSSQWLAAHEKVGKIKTTLECSYVW